MTADHSPIHGGQILATVSHYHRPALFALALAALASLLTLSVPLLIQGFVDRVILAQRWSELPAFVLVLTGIVAVQARVALDISRAIGRIGHGVVRDLRHAVYDRMQRLSLAYYDRTSAGSMVSRLMDDVDALQGLIANQTVTVLTDLCTALVGLAFLVARNGRVAAVVLAIVPIYFLNLRCFTIRIRVNSIVVRNQMDSLLAGLKEKLDGILLIKAAGREQAETAEFEMLLRNVHVPRVKDARLRTTFSSLSALISGIAPIAVFAIAAREALHGRMTLGEITSTSALAGLLFSPLSRLAELSYTFEQSWTSMRRLTEIFNLEPEVTEAVEAVVPIDRARGLIEFDRVSFSYSVGMPVIRDIRLRIEPGTKLAIVGTTGSGKSTLVNLLLRLYDPTQGEIRLDGIPLRRLRLSDVRRQFGVVLQDLAVLRMSVAENIRYGAPWATTSQIEAAARAAFLHDFAISLPDGYATVIGEGAFPLSDGQGQRLAIARAHLQGPGNRGARRGHQFTGRER